MTQQLNFQTLLDDLLAGGRTLAERGEDLAAQRLDVGDDEASRSNMRKGMLGGALGAGVMALMLGSKAGRRMGGTAAAVGGIAALGKMAYDKWQAHQVSAGSSGLMPIDRAEGTEGSDRARRLIVAMITAAKADGHMSQGEMEAIQNQLAPLGSDVSQFLMTELSKPVDAGAVAAGVSDPQEKAELYAVSAMVCGAQDPAERAYLDTLGSALGLDQALMANIEGGLRTAA
ncbi:MAG: tellurite resistance TerB family protein [Pseudomonadota bacterium]